MLPGRHKEKASAFRRWLVTRAYSPHPEPPVLRVGAILRERRAISRVMSWMIIYLAVPSPAQSSNLPGQCCLERQPTGRRSVLFGLASDGVYMCPGCYHPGGGLLHRLCTLTGVKPAVYFCCTFLGVASTGRYPASCPLKPGLSSPAAFRLCSRDHLPVFRYAL